MYKINMEIKHIKIEEKRLKKNIDKIEGNIQIIRSLNKEYNIEEVNVKLKEIIRYRNELIFEHNKLLFLINTIENIMEEVG